MMCFSLGIPNNRVLCGFAQLERKFLQHASPFSRLNTHISSLLKVTDFIKFTKEIVISLQLNCEAIFPSEKKYIINLAVNTKAAGN